MQTRFARAGEDMIPGRVSLALVLLLIVMRGVVAAMLPLSADEATTFRLLLERVAIAAQTRVRFDPCD